jgi:hypothetical protein
MDSLIECCKVLLFAGVALWVVGWLASLFLFLSILGHSMSAGSNDPRTVLVCRHLESLKGYMTRLSLIMLCLGLTLFALNVIRG